jgi:electron transfer flavoprotein alpha subunit
MNILVIAEHDHLSLAPATLNTLGAAKKLAEFTGGQVDLLVAGHGADAVASAAARLAGVRAVRVANAQHYKDFLAENFAALALAIARDYTHVLAPATTFGKNMLPRVAALLGVAQISEILDVLGPDTFKRAIYAGSIHAIVCSVDPIKVITVRPTAFEAAGEGGAAVIENAPALPDQAKSRLIGRTLTQSARPDLSRAKVVVSGGRGLGSAENFQALISPLADRLNGAIGASRAAVDAGFAPNDYQVGQTGKVVAPSVYIAIGLSGAIQHLAGMKESKLIVAINKDPDAPIFAVADYGLVGDLFKLVPELLEKLG